MNKKKLSGLTGVVVVAAVVIVVLIAGNRAINPPLPPPHVTVMSNPYGGQPSGGAPKTDQAARQ